MGDYAGGLYGKLSLWLSVFQIEGKKVAAPVCDIVLHMN